ncbi:MAG: OadG family protein [Oscillospiraceae bacterium]
MEYSNAFVCFMGIGIVFFGLICIIVLTKIMSALCGKAVVAPVAQTIAPPAAIPNRQELVAAVSAAIAESLGTDISAIRILSIKKL